MVPDSRMLPRPLAARSARRVPAWTWCPSARTKNGAVLAESVVFLDPALAADFKYVRKQSAQLASKMRFVSAQFIALLEDGLWLENAAHANAMARLLAERAGAVSGVRIMQPVEANEVFAVLPQHAIAPLQAEFDFYTWDERADEVRWVTSWDTTERTLSALQLAIARELGEPEDGIMMVGADRGRCPGGYVFALTIERIAATTSSACPSTFTFGQTRAIAPRDRSGTSSARPSLRARRARRRRR